MKNKNENLKSLSRSELNETLGGCSFAYDVGFGLKMIGRLGSMAGYLLIPGDVAIYNHHCG